MSFPTDLHTSSQTPESPSARHRRRLPSPLRGRRPRPLAALLGTRKIGLGRSERI